MRHYCRLAIKCFYGDKVWYHDPNTINCPGNISFEPILHCSYNIVANLDSIYRQYLLLLHVQVLWKTEPDPAYYFLVAFKLCYVCTY